MFVPDIYLLAFVASYSVLMILTVLQCIDTLLALPFSHTDPEEACRDLNERECLQTLIHFILSFTLFICGQEFLYLFNVPMLIWTLKNINVRKFKPRDVMDLDQISKRVQEYIVYLYFFIVCFILYLVSLIHAVLHSISQ